MVTSKSIADLRNMFYGGDSSEELAFLQSAYDEGISASDMLEIATSVGLSDIPAFISNALPPARYTGGTVMVNANNSADFTLMFVERKIEINALSVIIAVQSGNYDLGIYAADGTDGMPETKIISTGSKAVPAAGKETVAETTLDPGAYWAAIAADNTTASFRSLDFSGVTTHPLRGTHFRKATMFPLPSTVGGSLVTQNANFPAFIAGRV